MSTAIACQYRNKTCLIEAQPDEIFAYKRDQFDGNILISRCSRTWRAKRFSKLRNAKFVIALLSASYISGMPGAAWARLPPAVGVPRGLCSSWAYLDRQALYDEQVSTTAHPRCHRRRLYGVASKFRSHFEGHRPSEVVTVRFSLTRRLDEQTLRWPETSVVTCIEPDRESTKKAGQSAPCSAALGV